MTNNPDSWADVEQRPEALRSIASNGELPPGLEDRVVRTLQRRGLLGAAPRSRLGRWVLPVAAGLAALAVGFALGRRTPTVQAAASQRYALLLYEDASFQAPPRSAEAGYVAEYSRWAREVNAAGNGLTGEELNYSGRTIDSAGAAVDHDRAADGQSVLSGFFIVHAADLERATAIAKTCPHLKHGGRVVIRPIEPT
ncbi:MAG: YciI family protein [Gemmatimonadota bacterium]